jgi:DUF971 family protein
LPEDNVNEKPTKLSLNNQGDLIIGWSDDKTRVYRVAVLRDNCPCATCREKRKEEPSTQLLPVLSVEETQPMKITEMKPVGSYAYGITFSDGHDSGIYTLEHLFDLGAVSE